jgi:hypothetical protein
MKQEKIMALMTLLRLPTEAELEETCVEAHAFLDAFCENSVSGFTAKVEVDGENVILGEWSIAKADWFVVEDEVN